MNKLIAPVALIKSADAPCRVQCVQWGWGLQAWWPSFGEMAVGVDCGHLDGSSGRSSARCCGCCWHWGKSRRRRGGQARGVWSAVKACYLDLVAGLTYAAAGIKTVLSHLLTHEGTHLDSLHDANIGTPREDLVVAFFTVDELQFEVHHLFLQSL